MSPFSKGDDGGRDAGCGLFVRPTEELPAALVVPCEKAGVVDRSRSDRDKTTHQGALLSEGENVSRIGTADALASGLERAQERVAILDFAVGAAENENRRKASFQERKISRVLLDRKLFIEIPEIGFVFLCHSDIVWIWFSMSNRRRMKICCSGCAGWDVEKSAARYAVCRFSQSSRKLSGVQP